MKRKRYDGTRVYNKKLFKLLDLHLPGCHLPISERYLMKKRRGLC